MTEHRDEPQVIDLHFQGQEGVIASFLVESAGELALIETGPASTLDTLLAALQARGIEGSDISKLIVTHIHLDHSGAAGAFLRRFPQATVYVHELGARHLIDPSKLVSSASRIYGDRMDSLWGQVEPVPEERLVVLNDGDTVRIGAMRLDVLYTPGHAVHHVAYADLDSGNVFTGDVAACRIQGMSYVRPPTPPPDVDLEAWQRRLDRIAERSPRRLYLTHFGPFEDPERHVQQAGENLMRYAEIVRAGMEAGKDREQIFEDLKQFGDRPILAERDDPVMLERYELATPYGMSIDGLMRYYRKRVQ